MVSPWYGRGLLEQLVGLALAATGAVMVAPDCDSNVWADAPCAECALEAIELAVADFQADVARVLLTGYIKGGSARGDSAHIMLSALARPS